MKKQQNMIFLSAAIAFLVILVLFNSIVTFGLSESLSARVQEANEILQPADVTLITLTSTATCEQCASIDPIVESIKNANVNILEEVSVLASTQKGKELIEEFAIKKLPTVIIKGDIEKLSIASFKERKGALVYDGQQPPFIDARLLAVAGEVSTILVEDPNCDICVDLSMVPENLERAGVLIKKSETLARTSARAKSLIETYSIEKVPVLLISKDVDFYPVGQKIKESGPTDVGEYYLAKGGAPYIDTKTGQLHGKVSLTVVTDQLCEECYDVNVHKALFKQMGMGIVSEKTIDIMSAQGALLRSEYDLQKVPTVILQGDLQAYDGLEVLWKKIGTIEDDGTYVFRNVELIGQGIKYRDLTTEKIVASTTAGGLQ